MIKSHPLRSIALSLLISFTLGCKKDQIEDNSSPSIHNLSGNWKIEKIENYELSQDKTNLNEISAVNPSGMMASFKDTEMTISYGSKQERYTYQFNSEDRTLKLIGTDVVKKISSNTNGTMIWTEEIHSSNTVLIQKLYLIRTK